jgi:hypothetical protein
LRCWRKIVNSTYENYQNVSVLFHQKSALTQQS